MIDSGGNTLTIDEAVKRYLAEHETLYNKLVVKHLVRDLYREYQALKLELECERKGHDWKWVRDWYGDKNVPNGTRDCSHAECRRCGLESYEIEEGDCYVEQI